MDAIMNGSASDRATSSRPLHRSSTANSDTRSESRGETSLRRPWTAREDQVLTAAVKRYGSSTGPGSSWSSISREVGGDRTNKDCRKRWFYTLDPNLKRGRWTKEEDAILREAYAELGAQWKEIALRTSGRTDEQVAKRWRDVLSPELTLDAPWTSEEDALLLRLFDELGPKWTLMSDSFPGRNGIACRNRFRRHRNRIGEKDNLISTSFSAADDTDPLDALMEDNSVFDDRFLFPEATPPSTNENQELDFEFPSFSPMLDVNPPAGSGPFQELEASGHNSQAPDWNNIRTDNSSNLTEDWISSLNKQSINQSTYVGGESSTNNPSFGVVGPASHPPEWVAAETPFEDWLDKQLSQADPNPQNIPILDFQRELQDSAPAVVPSGNDQQSTGIQAAEDARRAGNAREANHQPPSKQTPADPITNVWGLLMALESGAETLTLTAALVRQLMSDASK